MFKNAGENVEAVYLPINADLKRLTIFENGDDYRPFP